MSLRLAVEADLPALLAFLRQHEAGSMFPLVNLVAGMEAAGPNGMRVWLGAGGMVGLTRGGMLLPQWLGGDWAAVAEALAGERVSGVLGPAEQVRAMIPALGLETAMARHDQDEPGFVLDLADLRMPEGAGDLRPLTGAERGKAEAWRAAYLVEVMGTPEAEAPAQAAKDVAGWMARGSHRMLWRGGAPVAMCGFNAALPEVVQVGGVYVPPALRGQGLARLAVARHLAEARSAGVQRAVLFAVSAVAARAYTAIGFVQRGAMALVLFDVEQVVRCR